MNTIASIVVVVVVAGAGAGASAEVDQPPAVATETLSIDYQPDDELAAMRMIDGLEPETVLTIQASGFDHDATGTVRQCLQARERRCRNPLTVRFDDRGAATFQYLVTDVIGTADAESEPCRLDAARCTIEVEVGDKISVIDTVFVDEAPPPGRLDVSPRRGLLVGDTVTVTASQFGPGTELTVMVCAEPSSSGPRCGAPGPEVPLTIGRDGTAEVEVALDAAEVGSDRIACGRRVACRMVVTSDQLGVRAGAVTLSFADSPGADYVTTRVIIGLTVALALVLLAGWLVRSTDWVPPRESDSTPIDEAELADLDLEAAQFHETEPVAPG